MRAVRFTKAEVAAVREALRFLGELKILDGGARDRAFKSVLGKLDEAEAEAAPGVSVGPIERALMATSRGKVVQLESGPAGYGRASKLATANNATVADAELVGAWLGRQRWMNEPTTVLGVLNKWAEWLPRARATAPPPATQEGFDGTAGAQASAGGSGGRGGAGGRGEGFR